METGGSLTAPESVRKLQTALHAKAKESPDFRFYALSDKVWRADFLQAAWHAVSSQPGMPNPASQRCYDASGADDAVAPGRRVVTMEPRRAAHGQSNRSSVTTLEESMILMSLAAACRMER